MDGGGCAENPFDPLCQSFYQCNSHEPKCGQLTHVSVFTSDPEFGCTQNKEWKLSFQESIKLNNERLQGSVMCTFSFTILYRRCLFRYVIVCVLLCLLLLYWIIICFCLHGLLQDDVLYWRTASVPVLSMCQKCFTYKCYMSTSFYLCIWNAFAELLKMRWHT